jgi:hypothetical protein
MGLSTRVYTDTIAIVLAIWGNDLYRRKLISVLDKTKHLTKKEQRIELSQKGGTSIVILSIWIVYNLVRMFVLGTYS